MEKRQLIKIDLSIYLIKDNRHIKVLISMALSLTQLPQRKRKHIKDKAIISQALLLGCRNREEIITVLQGEVSEK